jgi:putative ABC transport system substrate-binding protein
LREAGYVEGENVTVEYRWTDGHHDRLRTMAAELIRSPVAVLIAGGNAAVSEAKAATATIPIVFATGSDPIELGFVTRLNRPDGNVTGATFLSNSLRTKQLGLLRELVPKAATLAMLVNPNDALTADHVKEQQAAAKTLGVTLQIATATNTQDIDRVFANLAERRIGALYIAGDSLFTGKREQIIALAARYAIPAIYNDKESATVGGLMSYGGSNTDAFRQAGVYTGRILKGQKIADLPVLQPTKFELVINLKTAKALGLEVPLFLQQRADEVIE